MTRQILFLTGSLRKDSLNRRVSEIAARYLPEGYDATFMDLREIPPYDADLDHHDLIPSAVVQLRNAISECDAVYITTPEFNYALPGVVKNAIDWASRPLVPHSCLLGKPMIATVATISATNGIRALSDLKRFWSNVGGVIVPLPDLVIQNAQQRFSSDEEGRDTLDEAALKLLALSVRCLIRLAQSTASDAIVENWSDYLAVLTS